MHNHSGPETFLGIDIGTSSVKAVLFKRDGSIVTMGSGSYPLLPGPEGRAELDPDAVIDAVVKAVSTCIGQANEHSVSIDAIGQSNEHSVSIAATGQAKHSTSIAATGQAKHSTSIAATGQSNEHSVSIAAIGQAKHSTSIAAIGLSCAHHSLMAVDGKGKPLTRLMTWADNRASTEAAEMERLPEVDAYYHLTGCRVQHPMYPLAKMLWLKKNEADIFQKAAKFVSIKEYLLFQLYGVWVVDDTIASTQGFYDIHRHCWDANLVENLIGISQQRLSEVVPCTHTLTGMHADWANRLGLPRELPLIIGSGDGIMANLGSGVLDRSVFSSTIGTSGAIRTTVDAPLTDPNGSTWCYAFTRKQWVAGGAINNGGVALSWLKREFGTQYQEQVPEGRFLSETMDALAATVPLGSEGLVFLPYLLGERGPDWNAQARGMIAGLDFSHSRNHIVRAMMEGVMYRMSTIDDALSSLVGGGGVLRASGGYGHSDFWLQMQADMFGREVQVSDVSEASALGAAYLAMYAVGAVPNLTDGLPAMQPTRVFQPNSVNVALYKGWKSRAAKLYAALKDF